MPPLPDYDGVTRFARKAGVLAGLVIALVAHGCMSAEESPLLLSATGTGTRELFDSFENGNSWVVDSADDPARLEVTALKASNGASSLCVNFVAGKKRKVFIRRDEALDLQGAKHFTVDVWSQTKGMSVALAVITRPGGKYFESRAINVPALADDGTPKWFTLTFGLDGPVWKCAQSDWQHSAALANRADVERIALLVYTGSADEGEIFMDTLTFDKPAGDLLAGFAPRRLKVKRIDEIVCRWGRLELELTFEASYESPFDPGQIAVGAEVRTPSGTLHHVPGFISKDGTWRIRYMPLELGSHSFEVSVANQEGRLTTPRATFYVVGENLPGPVRVSRRDARQFEFASGEAFYPVGTNVAWASEFQPFFRQFAWAGGNLVRVWLAPWCLPVASKLKAGDVDLDAADRLEAVFELAKQHDLRVQLVLAYHGEFGDKWPESPYAAANGGPCSVPGEFFTDAHARGAFRNFMRYVAARFASHESLFAWELINEADLIPSLSPGDVVFWHTWMGRALRAYDPSGHLITTSVAHAGEAAAVEALPEIDFLQSHVYDRTIDTAMLKAMSGALQHHKPFYFGEFGGHWRSKTDQADKSGVRLTAGLWLSLASPASGTAMPWWWDIAIDPNGLWPRWRPIAALAKRIDRRGKQYRFINRRLSLPNKDENREDVGPPTTRFQGIISRTEGLLYFYDPRVLGDITREAEVTPEGGTIFLTGMMDGEFEVELWRPVSDSCVHTSKAVSENGRLALKLPNSRGEFAIYVKAPSASDPGVE